MKAVGYRVSVKKPIIFVLHLTVYVLIKLV